jgi:hypothetical protein
LAHPARHRQTPTVKHPDSEETNTRFVIAIPPARLAVQAVCQQARRKPS